MTAAVIDRLRGVDPDLGQVRLVDLDLRRRLQVVDEVLLRVDPLVAEQLVADRRLRVVEALRRRAPPAGLLEHVPGAVAGIYGRRYIADVGERERGLDDRRRQLG